MTFVPFQYADTVGDRFLALLSTNKIQPPSGSSLEDELLSLTQLIEVMQNPGLAQGSNTTLILRAAAGVHDFAAKVLSVGPLPDFAGFLPHLRLIAQSKVTAASLAQNTASGQSDDTARKMAELYFGCLAAHVGTDVILDSPNNAKGDNPDVIFKVQEDDPKKSPQQWALAIKTISSGHGQTIFERIKEGADQINRCPADRGMVVMNAKSALDHDALWASPFADIETARTALGTQLDTLATSANTDRPQEEWDAVFAGKAVRPVLFLGQSLVRVATIAGPETPTALKMLKVYDANGTLDPVGRPLADCLNHYMQTVLQGVPGGPGHPPR